MKEHSLFFKGYENYEFFILNREIKMVYLCTRDQT